MGQDLEEIRRLTLSYRFLRGYEQIPFALLWLAMVAAEVAGWRRPGVLTHDLTLVVAFVATVVASYPIRRYYDRRFGVVKPAPGTGFGFWVVVFFALITLQVVSVSLDLPLQLGLLAAGLGLAVYSLRRFKLEGHRLFLAAFLMLVSVWPPVADTSGGFQDPWYSVFGFGFGALWIAMGIWDHRTLVRAFERSRLEEPHAAR